MKKIQSNALPFMLTLIFVSFNKVIRSIAFIFMTKKHIFDTKCLIFDKILET